MIMIKITIEYQIVLHFHSHFIYKLTSAISSVIPWLSLQLPLLKLWSKNGAILPLLHPPTTCSFPELCSESSLSFPIQFSREPFRAVESYHVTQMEKCISQSVFPKLTQLINKYRIMIPAQYSLTSMLHRWSSFHIGKVRDHGHRPKNNNRSNKKNYCMLTVKHLPDKARY